MPLIDYDQLVQFDISVDVDHTICDFPMELTCNERKKQKKLLVKRTIKKVNNAYVYHMCVCLVYA